MDESRNECSRDEPILASPCFAVTILGKDKPGIVAGATEVLFRLGFNVEDSSCTLLGGQFAMILIVSHVTPFEASVLSEAFQPFSGRMGLSVFIRPLGEDERHYIPPEGELCVVSVHGADRPGIVYQVTQALAERRINITDLNTRLVGGPEHPAYILMLEATLPSGVTVEDVSHLLERLKTELNVEISVSPLATVSL
jgi:glycine cleavage system transcriptional repressor